jgi:hypothetical protein
MGAVKGRWALSVPIITTNIRQLVQFTRRKPSQEDLQRSVLFLAEQIPARVVKVCSMKSLSISYDKVAKSLLPTTQFSQRLASPQFASTPASRRLLGVCGDLVSTVYAARNEHVQVFQRRFPARLLSLARVCIVHLALFVGRALGCHARSPARIAGRHSPHTHRRVSAPQDRVLLACAAAIHCP